MTPFKICLTVETPPGQPKRIASARAGYVTPGGSTNEKEKKDDDK